MNISEVNKYIISGNTKSICIHRCLLDEYHGFVRDVIIRQDNQVVIEINTYGYDEGGLQIVFKYEDQLTLIDSLEVFLNKPITEWENINKSGWYPDPPQNVNYDEAGKSLKLDLANRTLPFPRNWFEYQIPSNYWNDIAGPRIKEVGLD